MIVITGNCFFLNILKVCNVACQNETQKIYVNKDGHHSNQEKNDLFWLSKRLDYP